MSKRDDDSQADMEVGMTTAERRRRRRRGGGLRVPSDNVPRRSNNSSPPVVAPVPEDPSLAMSIAYSFSNDASEPIADGDGRRRPDSSMPPMTFDGSMDPIAPEAVPTFVDPVEPADSRPPIEEQSFESKTREMTAVDLEALGLSESGSSYPRVTDKGEVAPTQNLKVTFLPATTIETAPPEDSVIVDDSAHEQSTTDPGISPSLASNPGFEESPEVADLFQARTITAPQDEREPEPDPDADSVVYTPPEIDTRIPENQDMPARRPRLATVALTEEDLEEVMEAARAITNTPVPPRARTASSPPPQTPGVAPAPTVAAASPAPQRALSASESVPEIDISDLSERADSSSESAEIEISVDDESSESRPNLAALAPSSAGGAAPVEPRTRPPSVPPPIAPDKQQSSPSIPPPTPAAGDKASPPPTPDKTTADKQSSPALQAIADATGSNGQHAKAAPPPTPAQHKAPPAPPPKKAPIATQAAPNLSPSANAKVDGKAGTRGKPWFVDLFDEDYLRTLPFLTPQATQAEAEFAVDAMNLSPGAQVLDVGCGYGRHAMELAARGFHVVGLDLSTPLLVRGGEEAHRRGLTINFIRGDMRELDFDGQFDGAYCLFSTFGYFDDETNKKTAQNIARALKPGGKVLIEILNRDYIIQDLPTRVWWEGEGCVVLEEVELNYFSSRIQVNRSVVFDDGRQLEQEISVRAYSLHEVGKLMHAAGFRVLEVSGGYQTRGRFFGNQSRHIVVLAERRDTAT